MKNTNDQKWVMFKEDWLITVQKLPLETQARFIQGLLTGEITEDVFANVLIEQHIQEFNRVNEYAQQARDLRKEKSKKAAEARWSNKQEDAKECLSIPQAELKEDVSNASQCHTNTSTNTSKNINKKEIIINNKIKNNNEEILNTLIEEPLKKINNSLPNLGVLGFSEASINYSDYFDDPEISTLRQRLEQAPY